MTVETIKQTKITADEGMVLCDGYVKTSVRENGRGGTVTMPYTTKTNIPWQEMTDEEADALIAENEAKLAAEAEEGVDSVET